MKVNLSRLVLCFCALVWISGVASAQQQPFQAITYRLAMSRPVSHLFEVSIEVELPANSKETSISFQMPKWSPGRYAVFDFAKNVQEVHALSGVCPPRAQCKMAPRPITRVNDQTWSVET
ncbi:MAG: hypothetical protein DMF69_03650, partial [Acidobacteria bacterium]